MRVSLVAFGQQTNGSYSLEAQGAGTPLPLSNDAAARYTFTPHGARHDGYRPITASGTENIVLSDPGLGSYKKLVMKDGKLAGAVLFDANSILKSSIA